MRYVIGIDLGTSGTKTVLFEETGLAISSCTVEYPLYQPQNGYAEQDPQDWVNATYETVTKVITESGVNVDDIKGVGISGQMHGLVMLDENMKVLRKSILWCDGRTVEECEEITETIGYERLIELTANPALTGFTLGKILWVRKNEPELYAKCKHIVLPKDYVRYCLTGKLNMEVSDASGMNLLDIRTRDWCDEIIEKLDLNKSMFPSIIESADVAGTITKEASEKTLLSEQTVVVGGAGDNMSAAVGLGVIKNGRAFTSIGTSGVIFAHTDKITLDPQGRVHTFCAAVPNEYTAMSCTLAAGLSLKWYRDTFCGAEMETANQMGVDPYYLMDKEAENIAIGADKLVFLPYLMGERSPTLDSKSRGAFFGLSAIHTKSHMLRAVLEGVMYSQKHCLEVLKEMDVVPSEMLACGGGGTSPLWRQMMADIFNCNVKVAENKEGPALGVALLATVGAGIYANIGEACDNAIKYKAPQAPVSENVFEYDKYYGIYKNLYPALKDSFAALYSI